MIYPYACQACGATEERNVSVEQRDAVAMCSAPILDPEAVTERPCHGPLKRDVSAQFRSHRIFTPKLWCACTAADLTPTREESASLERSLSEMRKPERKPNAFQVAREQIAAGVL
jgi:hypothetical protein